MLPSPAGLQQHRTGTPTSLCANRDSLRVEYVLIVNNDELVRRRPIDIRRAGGNYRPENAPPFCATERNHM